MQENTTPELPTGNKAGRVSRVKGEREARRKAVQSGWNRGALSASSQNMAGMKRFFYYGSHASVSGGPLVKKLSL